MTDSRKIRLIQVAKEFKVGLNTVTDFLLKKGINTDMSPNSLVAPEVYAVLEKEFGSNRSITGNERENIREKIQGNRQSVTLSGKQSKSKEEDDREVVIKSNVISVKDEVPQPKILGKIDLEPKKVTGGLFMLAEDRQTAVFLPNVEIYASFVIDQSKTGYFNLDVTPTAASNGVTIYLLEKAEAGE